jgi:acyl-CoA dehydrogenase
MSPSFNLMKNPLLQLSPEEETFRDSVSDFCSRELSPNWESFDEQSSREAKLQSNLLKKLGEQGILAMMCSPDNGGQGGSETQACIAIEEMAYADPSVGTAVYALLNIGWPFILERYGDSEVASKVIKNVSRGEAFFGIASTEAQGGSDLAGLRTVARPGNVGYIVKGEKSFISGVNEVFTLPWGGGWFLLARTGGAGHSGLSAFVALPKEEGRERDGVTHSVFRGIGRHSLSTGSVTFEGFHIERNRLIGKEGAGFHVAMEGFNCARILVAAACVGASRWLLEKGAEWIKRREVSGKPLSSFQGVGFRFAELYGKYESARMLVYRAARLFDDVYVKKVGGMNPKDLNGPVALAKMWGPETSVEIAQEVMRWFGAISFTTSHPVHRSFLGLISYVIGAEGAQNVMKYIVSRELLGSEFVR